MSRKSMAVLFVCALTLTGCSSMVDVLEPDRAPALMSYNDEMPPEYQQDPSIGRYWTDVGFIGDNAYGQAYMQYYGNRAEQRLTLTLRNDAGTIGTATGLSEQQRWTPALTPSGRDLWTDAGIALNSSCTFYLDGSTTHSAWHEFLTRNGGWLSWGRTTQSSWKSATRTGGGNAQSVDPLFPPSYDYTPSPDQCGGGSPGGGGGSGGGNMTCYTIATDHYWYYPDTGTYEYRYTSYSTHCYINME
jgi:hypothetical protein